jgi:hypothetical protein
MVKITVRVPTQGIVNFDRWLSVGIGYMTFLSLDSGMMPQQCIGPGSSSSDWDASF